MRIEQLQYYIEAVESKSLNKAAQRFYISQQAISKAIVSLEKEFGMTLVERSNQGIQLTEAGNYVYQFAKETLFNLKETQCSIDALKIIKKETLHIYMNMLVSNTVLMNDLLSFQKIHPQITTNFFVMDSTDIQDMVLSKQDAAQNYIVISTFSPDIIEAYGRLGYHILPIHNGKVTFVASQKHELAYRKHLRLDNIMKYPIMSLVTNIHNNNSWLQQYQQSHHVVLDVRETTSENIWFKAIANGNYIGMATTLMHFFAEEQQYKLDNLTTLDIDEILPSYLYAIAPPLASPQTLQCMNYLTKL